MTPEQLDAVERTVQAVEADPEAFAHRFYEELFALAPDIRDLFPQDMAEQRGKLVEEILFLAGAARDLTGFTERARDLGARHRHYGVRARHYQLFETALLGTLAQMLPGDWTPEVEEAWRRLHRLVSETMLEGASGELFSGG
jgi:hemoglobin-like flavoprotein